MKASGQWGMERLERDKLFAGRLMGANAALFADTRSHAYSIWY